MNEIGPTFGILLMTVLVTALYDAFGLPTVVALMRRWTALYTVVAGTDTKPF